MWRLIGPATLWSLEHGFSVIAVEPDPMALLELRRRASASVEIWEGAVGMSFGAAASPRAAAAFLASSRISLQA